MQPGGGWQTREPWVGSPRWNTNGCSKGCKGNGVDDYMLSGCIIMGKTASNLRMASEMSEEARMMKGQKTEWKRLRHE